MQEYVQEANTQDGRYLIFSLGQESFGLEIACVTEIVGMETIAWLPEAPSYVKGVINLRGKVIPVLDMRLRFGMEGSAYTNRTCIIIADIQGVPIGLIVDSVSEVLAIDDGDIAPPPAAMLGAQNKYLRAIGKAGGGIKLLLDCDRLLNADELDHLATKGEQ